MPEIELDINYLVSCIESINQINSIPAAEGLKEVVNRWVDERTDEALADPALRLQVYSIWRKLSGDSDSERVVEWIPNLPDQGLGGEVRQFVLERVNQQLDEAMKDPANKMFFFRSWLATSPENVPGQDAVTAEQTVDQSTGDSSELSASTENDEHHHQW